MWWRGCHRLPWLPVSMMPTHPPRVQVFSKKLSQYADCVGPNVGKYMGAWEHCRQELGPAGLVHGWRRRFACLLPPPCDAAAASYPPPSPHFIWATICRRLLLWRPQVCRGSGTPGGGGGGGGAGGRAGRRAGRRWRWRQSGMPCHSTRHAAQATPRPPPWPTAGRFAGPLVVAGVTRIATPDGQVNFCTDWQTGANGTPDCVGPWDQQCAITGDMYWVGGCVLYNAIPMYSAVAGASACCAAGPAGACCACVSLLPRPPAMAAPLLSPAAPACAMPAAAQFLTNIGFALVLARNWSWGTGDPSKLPRFLGRLSAVQPAAASCHSSRRDRPSGVLFPLIDPPIHRTGPSLVSTLHTTASCPTASCPLLAAPLAQSPTMHDVHLLIVPSTMLPFAFQSCVIQ